VVDVSVLLAKGLLSNGGKITIPCRVLMPVIWVSRKGKRVTWMIPWQMVR